MLTRTVIYARVSTEDQIEKYGLPSQLRACRDYANAQGLSVVAEISDDGVSGTLLQRPGLDRVRELVRAGEAEVVLVYDTDRLSRELAHLLILKPEIERRARLEFVAARFEDSPSGRLFFGIRGVVAQFEREQLLQRTRRGKRERAQAGLIVGGRTAYGYRYDQGRLVEDPPHAAVVRRIYADYDAGMSLRGLTLALRESQAPTWGGKPWAYSSVRRILLNETYAGLAHYGTLRREGPRLVQASTTERIALPVTPLVEREQWERIQRRLAENAHAGRPTPHFLLRGLLHCGLCGRRMIGETTRRCRAYRCNGRDLLRSVERCRTHAPVQAVDAAVWRVIEAALTDRDNLRRILAARERELRAEDPAAGREALERTLTRLRAKEAHILGLLCDPELDRAALQERYRAVRKEKARIEWELAEARRVVVLPEAGWLESTVELLAEHLPTLTQPEERQAFVRGLVQRAEYRPEVQEVTMSCFLGAELSTTSTRSAQFPAIAFVLHARLAA